MSRQLDYNGSATCRQACEDGQVQGDAGNGRAAATTAVDAEGPPAGCGVLEAGLDLHDLGYWVVVVRARGEPIRRKNPRFGKDSGAPEFVEKPAEGKEPPVPGWGKERWTKDRLRAELARRPGRGIGVCLGPGRGPDGGWRVDVEGDGEGAMTSLCELIGGEPPPTVSWDATRGGHWLFTAHGPRLLGALQAAGAREEQGSPGVWHLNSFPGLEF